MEFVLIEWKRGFNEIRHNKVVGVRLEVSLLSIPHFSSVIGRCRLCFSAIGWVMRYEIV
jgi:hypothetical protein